MKNLGWLVFFTVALLSVGTVAQGQHERQDTEDEGVSSEDAIDLQTMTCREFLKTDGEEGKSIAIFLHGYMSGVAGSMTVNGPELAIASERIFDDCIDNPEASLFSTFEAHR